MSLNLPTVVMQRKSCKQSLRTATQGLDGLERFKALRFSLPLHGSSTGKWALSF